MLHHRYVRNEHGQAVIVLVTLLIVFFGLVLGMTAFEMARYSLCCQEFQHSVDAAALGGAAGLASSNNTNQAASQAIAISTSQWVFERNTVLANPLSGQSTYAIATTPPATPAANQARLHYRWLDPETGQPTNNIAAQKIMNIQGAYGYRPLIGTWIGLPAGSVFRVTANGNGGGPMLDVILCFDLSGSIDDSTKVTFVQRYFTGPNQGQGKNKYKVVNPNGDGTLYKVTGCSNLTGSSVNACYPQELDDVFANGMGNLNFDYGRRGQTQGTPPGQEGQNNNNAAFTDMVVNLDENDVFGGYSYNGFDFPTVGALVEAARGNLENNGMATSSNVDLAAIGVTNPRPGYYQAYWQAALQHRHPLFDAQSSSATFLQIMNNSIDCHFGFVGFSTDENAVMTNEAVSYLANHNFPGPPNGPIPTTPTVQTPIPLVALNPAPGAANSGFGQIMQWLPPNNPPNPPQLSANGGTDINGALTLAMQNFLQNGNIGTKGQIQNGLNRSRTGSTKAIVLFTDGLPTANTGIGTADGMTIANKAAQEGIKIYCIGLAQIPELVSPMTNTLQPIATTSGGKLYTIPPGANQSAALDRAFQDIARSLVALVR